MKLLTEAEIAQISEWISNLRCVCGLDRRVCPACEVQHAAPALLWVANLAVKLVPLVKEGECEACAQIVDAWTAYYPEDVFPATGTSRDAIAGTAIRTILPRIAAEIRDRCAKTGRWAA